MPRKQQFPQDFFNKVYIPFPLDDDVCWPWVGPSITPYYYGNFGSTRATRVILEKLYCIDMTSLSACHHCDHPPCVRPSHLFAGTHKENIEDATIKNRMATPLVARQKISTTLLGHQGWMKGKQHTDEAKQKISLSLQGHGVSEETRYKLRNANIGKIPWNKGRPTPPLVKQKLSTANLGKTLSEETKQKISIAGRGKFRSEATRARMSEAAKLREAKKAQLRRKG